MVVEAHQPGKAGEGEAERERRDSANAELAHDVRVLCRSVAVLRCREVKQAPANPAEENEIDDDAKQKESVRQVRLLGIEQRVHAWADFPPMPKEFCAK